MASVRHRMRSFGLGHGRVSGRWSPRALLSPIWHRSERGCSAEAHRHVRLYGAPAEQIAAIMSARDEAGFPFSRPTVNV